MAEKDKSPSTIIPAEAALPYISTSWSTKGPFYLYGAI